MRQAFARLLNAVANRIDPPKLDFTGTNRSVHVHNVSGMSREEFERAMADVAKRQIGLRRQGVI